MKPSPLIQIKNLGNVSSFAVFSDIHLRNPGEPNEILLETLLAAIPKVDHIIFLGDIFDFIFIRSPFFQKRWQKFIDICENIQKGGTSVSFVEGNHDFGFEHRFPKHLEQSFAIHGDLSLQLSHPKLGKIMLRHGDDIVCPNNYLAFRQTLKNRLFQDFASLVPGFVMQYIFSRWAKISRSQAQYRRMSPSFFSDCVAQRSLHFPINPQILILGHVHEHIKSNINGLQCLAGPSWLESPNYLLCDKNGNLERIFPGGKDVPLFPIPMLE